MKIVAVLAGNEHRCETCGVKVCRGSSTGNMLVDNLLSLERLFRESEVLIATHCEDERIIKTNLARIKAEKSHLEPSDQPIIRDVDACFESSFMAVQIAKRYNTRLHILHISTARELQLFSNMLPLAEKRITCEVCVHHLHFTADDYATLGNRIKCNPAIKSPENRAGLWQALLDYTIEVLSTSPPQQPRYGKPIWLLTWGVWQRRRARRWTPPGGPPWRPRPPCWGRTVPHRCEPQPQPAP